MATNEQWARVDQARAQLAQARKAFAQTPAPALSSSIRRLQGFIRRNSVTRWNVEFTDTYGGDANYCWVRRFGVNASSVRGAARLAARHLGYSGRIVADGSWGNGGRWNIRGAALCFFVEWHDSTRPGDAESYPLINGREA